MGEPQEARLIDRQRNWLDHIEACEASGKRVSEYAADHGLGVLPRTHLGRFQRVQVASVTVDRDLAGSIA